MAMQEIGAILLKDKALTKEDLEFALTIQKSIKSNERIGRILKYYNLSLIHI